MVVREAHEAAERAVRLLTAALVQEEARRLGEEEHAVREDRGPEKLDRDGDAPRRVIQAPLRGVEDDGGEERADGN